MENEHIKRNVNIIEDLNGNHIVMINDIYLREAINRDFPLGNTKHVLECEISLDGNLDNTRWVSMQLEVAKNPDTNELVEPIL